LESLKIALKSTLSPNSLIECESQKVEGGGVLSREGVSLTKWHARLTCSRIDQRNYDYRNDISNTTQMGR